jgi:hypothetical protein
MDPNQRNVRRHRAERNRVVPDTGEILVRGPVVGDQPGLRSDGGEQERMELLGFPALLHPAPVARAVRRAFGNAQTSPANWAEIRSSGTSGPPS